MDTVLKDKDSFNEDNDAMQKSQNAVQATVKYNWLRIWTLSRLKRRLKEDRNLKEKLCYSLCIYCAFFVLGWIKGQFGPSFPDLRLISDVDIEKGSWIVTTFYIGYTVGSVLEGFLYNRVDRKLLFFTCLLILAVTVAVIPWCFRFEAMVFAHLVQGVMEGVLDPGGNAEILRIWDSREGRTAILGMNFALSIGSVISPLATAPFLSETLHKNYTLAINDTFNITLTHSNLTFSELTIDKLSRYHYNFTKLIIGNEILSSIDQESRTKSRLYIAYSMTAVVSLIVAITFLVLTIYFSRKRSDDHSQNMREDSKETTRPLPSHLKRSCLIIISASLFTFNAIDEGFIAYLSSFCVSYFDWSNNKGAFLTSLLFISNLSTRLVYLVISKWVNSLVCVGIHSVTMFLSLLGVLATSITKYDTALWGFVPMFGYGKAVLFALLFSWTNEYLTPVTGKISSLYFISAMIGSSLNPLLLGYLMKHIATIWFGYLFAIEGALLVFLFIIGAILTKYVTSRFGRAYTIEQAEENVTISTRL